MYKYRKPDTWLDKIDLNMMPYVDAPEWENRYPTNQRAADEQCQ